MTSTDVGVHDPLWSYRRGALVGLTDDGRVAEMFVPSGSGKATTRLSPPMAAGRNLQISGKNDERIFVPVPQRGKVAVIDLTTLSQVEEFDAGPSPAYLSEDRGMRTLLALSADGSSVTPVDEYGFRQLSRAAINGKPSDTIDGANRGREVEYHVYGRDGIRYFKGASSPPEERGSLPLAVVSSATDGTAVTRSFVAGPTGNTLYAIDSNPDGQGLRVVATAELPSPVRRIATDDTRVYAATDQEVAVLEIESFTGYPHGTIPVLRATNYRAALPESQRNARLSGVALGPHRVYLTFGETPLVVSVAKPRL